jgi:AmmeMemoRadiSam system protein B
MKNRDPVVAGTFYPQSPAQLRANLANLLQALPHSELIPKALIVPHAGYFYSGQVAAAAYGYLKKYHDKYQRVILLGPSHQMPLQDSAISDFDAFCTPLGPVTIDKLTCYKLLNLNYVRHTNLAHRWEHSLEVQLPFLQQVLSNFELIPIVTGCDSPKALSKMLAIAGHAADSLFIVSTDLSHYHSYEHCQRLDKLTIEHILNFRPVLQPHDACGCSALNGLLEFARNQGWQIELISQANSGDVGEDKNEVVGYASFVLY